MKKVIKMNKELDEAIIRQVESFKEKFGREPGPDDPLFFDPDCDVPIPLSELKLRKVTPDVNSGHERLSHAATCLP